MRFPKFCKQCGIQLQEGILGMGKKYYTFEDGDYCPKCAKNKVEKARENN